MSSGPSDNLATRLSAAPAQLPQWNAGRFLPTESSPAEANSPATKNLA